MYVFWLVLTLLCACSNEQRSEAVTPPAADSGEPRQPTRAPIAAGEPPAAMAPTLSDSGQSPGETTAPPLDAAHAQPPLEDAGQPLAANSRAILVGQVENARDLGGIALAAGQRVKARSLFRGPPLAGLSQRGCAEVAKLGLHSVIDLRVDSEVSLQPDQTCALEQAQLVAAALPVPYNVSAEDYIADLDARESIAKAFEVLGDAARYPVYFHCTWGRDRTGILAAVILLALGAEHDAIMEDYLESRRTVGAYPASLEAALAEITRRGGIDAYLTASGVSTHQLEVLRATAAQ